MPSIKDILDNVDFSYPQGEMVTLDQSGRQPKTYAQPPWAPPGESALEESNNALNAVKGAQIEAPSQGEAIRAPISPKSPVSSQDVPLSEESKYFPSLETDTIGGAMEYDADRAYRHSLNQAVQDMVGHFSGFKATPPPQEPSALSSVMGIHDKRVKDQLERLKAVHEKARIVNEDARTKAYEKTSQSQERIAQANAELKALEIQLSRETNPLKIKEQQGKIIKQRAEIGKILAETEGEKTSTLKKIEEIKNLSDKAGKLDKQSWETIAATNEAMTLLDSSLALFSSLDISGLTGRFKNLAGSAGFENEATLFKKMLEPIATVLGKFVAGGVLSDAEKDQMLKALPGPGTRKDDAPKLVAQFKTTLRAKVESKIKTWIAEGKTIPDSMYELAGLPKPGGAQTQAPPAQQAGKVKVIMPDGSTEDVSPAVAKRMIENGDAKAAP